MRWEDERFVRVYTRDTVTWKMLPWQGRTVLLHLLRRVDRAGLLDLGGADPVEAVCAVTELPPEVVEPGLEAILRRPRAGDPTAEIRGDVLVLPNFLEAQEAVSSDAQRKRDQRERARARVRYDSLTGHGVTERDTGSRNVTERHAESRAVTGGHSDPICSVPSRTEEISHARAHEAQAPQPPPPGPAAVPPRCDARRLQETWLTVTGKIAADGLSELARTVEEAAAAQRPPADPDEYAERCVRAFAAWVDGVHASRRPQKSPRKLLEHFARVQAIVAGEQPAVPEERDARGRPFTSVMDAETRQKAKGLF